MEHWMPVPPEEDAYSYLMFTPPIEHRRAKRYMTPLSIFAVVLVVVNFVMQGGLLYVIGQHIMRKHIEWVSSIANLKHHAWYHVMPMPYNLPPPKCRGKDSPLCFEHGDGLSCSPPSVHLLTNWARLDTDGDGTWSQEEAEEETLQEQIQCEYDIDLPSLYRDMVTQINASSGLLGRRDTDLLRGSALHKAYLDWYLHKPLLCQYGDQDMCGALFKRGFFDEALRQKSSTIALTEFNSTKNALKYCTNLLQYECFSILPNSYRVWRSVANQQCGDKVFGQGLYHSPTDGSRAVKMLTVDFKKRREYASTRSVAFRAFLGILLVTFLSVMALELRSISKAFTWCAMFPADADSSSDRLIGSGAVAISHSLKWEREHANLNAMDLDWQDSLRKSIFAVRTDHRLVVLAVTVVRALMWCFLMWSGIMFLTGPPRYLDLIFDALSLLFIFQIDELLFNTMLRFELKHDHMTMTEMRVPQWHRGYLPAFLSVVFDGLFFISVIAFACAIVYTYTHNELNPLIHSLECLCSTQGSQCYAAQHYSKTWWDTYWSTTLPASNAIIDQLKQV